MSVLILAASGVGSCTHPPPPLRVAAASSLGDALAELGVAYRHTTGLEVQVVLGASEQLAQQIAQGAPYDVFASADPEILTPLERSGVLLPDSVTVFATGRLVAWMKADAPHQLITFADVAGPGIARIAMANPDLAPFGRAAKEALKAAGLEAAVAKRLVVAENVQQAWRYASTGNADVALTALSVVPPGEGRVLLIDPKLYAPVRESLALVKGSPRAKEAQDFVAFVLSAANHPVFERHGFGPPPDAR